MNKKILALGFVVLLLSACAKEPMIKLSDERKAQLESISQEQAEQSQTEAIIAATNLDRSSFTSYQEPISFDQSTEFIPIQPNTVIKMATSDYYLDYVDSASQTMQVRQSQADQDQASFFTWDLSAITYYGSQDIAKVPLNQLETIDTASLVGQVWLSFPLELGKVWQVDDGTSASVTAIYQEARINDQTYQDVVEVTYQSDTETLHRFFARNIGLIAWESVTDQEVQATDSIQRYQTSSQYRANINVYQPSKDNDGIKLTSQAGQLRWQTNDQIGNVFTQLFRDLSWIDDQIVVNNVFFQEDVLTLDFSSGIVAVLNSHETGEEGMIPAIVASLADLYGVDRVRLSVNGLGLLPDLLDYPDGGIWLLNQDWFN